MPRPNVMLPSERLTELLDVKTFAFAERPRVVDLHVQEQADPWGEDALWVYIVVADDTTDEDVQTREAGDISTLIRERVHGAGDGRFVYTWLGTRDEYERFQRGDADDE